VPSIGKARGERVAGLGGKSKSGVLFGKIYLRERGLSGFRRGSGLVGKKKAGGDAEFTAGSGDKVKKAFIVVKRSQSILASRGGRSLGKTNHGDKDLGQTKSAPA